MYNINEASNSISKDSLFGLTYENINPLSSIIDSLVSKYVNIWWELCRKPVVKASEITDFWGKRERQAYTDKRNMKEVAFLMFMKA